MRRPEQDMGNLRVALNALAWFFRLWPDLRLSGPGMKEA